MQAYGCMLHDIALVCITEHAPGAPGLPSEWAAFQNETQKELSGASGMESGIIEGGVLDD